MANVRLSALKKVFGANAPAVDVDELKIVTIMVDEGPSLKRFMARAKGRGTRILKRTSHITVVVGAGK